jgi:ABC-2 type transport system permease protein
MGAFFATLHKELLLLSRDRGGLALLFLMPMVLVLVVSLVQDNVL